MTLELHMYFCYVAFSAFHPLLGKIFCEMNVTRNIINHLGSANINVWCTISCRDIARRTMDQFVYFQVT